jgi:hypothetical protein
MIQKLLTHFAHISTARITTVLAMLVVATIGTVLLLGSHASSPYISKPAPNGTLASGAAACADTTASTASSVVFTAPVPTDGTVALGLSCPGTPFSSTSFWNTPLPDSISANPNTAAYQNDIAYALCQNTTIVDGTPPTGTACPHPYNGALAAASYSAPLYVVPANQPYVPVVDSCGHGSTSTFDTVLAPGVPVPADAHSAAGTDQHIQIYQPSTDKYWEFWHFVKNSSGVWGACYGGLISSVSQSNGIFPSDTGGTATSLPLIGGIVRIEELQAGRINHVVNLMLQENLNNDVMPANVPVCATPPTTTDCTTGNKYSDLEGVSWPATRSDGVSTDPLAIPEGQRFRLPPDCSTPPADPITPCVSSATLDSLSPVAKVIAAAVQKYGFVVDDTAGGIAIRMGDPTTYTAAGLPNPYTSGAGVGGINNGNAGLFGDGASSMANFPWDQLEALPFNYGEPSS